MNFWSRVTGNWKTGDRSRCPEARLIASTVDLDLFKQSFGASADDNWFNALEIHFYGPSANEQIAAAVELQKTLLRRMDSERLKEELAELRTRYVVALGGTAPTPALPLPTDLSEPQMLAEGDNLWDQLKLVYSLSHERDLQIDRMRQIGLVALGLLFFILVIFALGPAPAARAAHREAQAPGAAASNIVRAAFTSMTLPSAGPASVDSLPPEGTSAKPDIEPTPSPPSASTKSSAQQPETYPPHANDEAAKYNSFLNYLIVVVAASAGAVVSILQRIHVAATLNPLAADPIRQVSALRLGRSGLLAAALMGPASAMVLLMAFASEAVKVPSITPGFVACDTLASSGFIFLDHCAAAATRNDAAMILVWSFLAGFAERLVPDVLDRFVNAVRVKGAGG